MLGLQKREKVNRWRLYEPPNTSKTRRSRWVDYVPQSVGTWWKCYRKGEEPPRSERMQAKLRRKKGRGDGSPGQVLDPGS